MEERRIWVGCLNCYNSGTLTGEWFDVDEVAEADIDLEAVHAHGKSSRYCEELWVMDHEGFCGLIESEGQVSTFYAAAAVLDRIADELGSMADSDSMEIVIEHLRESQGWEWADWEITYDSVAFSTYDDWADYAEQICEDVYELDRLPGLLRYSIDWERVGNELRMETVSYVETDGLLYIFND